MCDASSSVVGFIFQFPTMIFLFMALVYHLLYFIPRESNVLVREAWKEWRGVS